MKIFYLLLVALIVPICLFSQQIFGCTDTLAYNFNPNATDNNGTCSYSTTTIVPITSVQLPLVMQETSGLIFFDDFLLTHNDDIDTNLYLFDVTNPTNFTTIPIPNVQNIDWEEISEDEEFIYIGDFGNNASGNRTNLRIYRIKKDELQSNPIIDTISFSYDLQTDFSAQPGNSTNFDCEAFIVTENKIYLFTKEWITKKTSVYELDKNPGNHIAVFKEVFDVQGLITGATCFEDKKLIVLTGYTQILQPFIYLLYDYNQTDFFSGNKRKLNLNMMFHQVEGIASKDGLNYYISNERFVNAQINVLIEQQLHHLDLTNYLYRYLSRDSITQLSVSNNFMNHFDIQLFPNPTTSSLTIDIPEQLDVNELNLQIVDNLGRYVSEIQLTNNISEIDLQAIIRDKGIYQLIILDNNGVILQTKRFFYQ